MDLVAHLLHIRADLLGNLGKNLLGEVPTCHTLLKFNKLDDISCAFLATRVAKFPLVPIQLFHGAEVSVSHTNNND